MYVATTATHKILRLTKRIRAVAGGSSASKTISILLILIDYAQSNDNELISVVSESMPHLRKGAMRDFENIMVAQGYWDPKRWNKTNSIYEFETGTKIEFFGADDSRKVRGPRRDVLFMNEANNVYSETFNQLEIRTNKIIYLDWNPVAEFWFYVGEDNTAGLISRDDVDFITVTYKDNEALPKSIVETLEMRKGNKNWWRVYGEGQLGEAEGRIYTGWEVIDEVPSFLYPEKYGLDFGYTNDPTAVVAVYKYNGGLLFDEILYRKGLLNSDIAKVLLVNPPALVIADSSEPKSIAEIATYGVKIVGAPKGADSVVHGIQYLQQQKVYVTKRSTNLLKEQRNYLWLTDKNGKALNVPQDFLNHCLDACRYAAVIDKPAFVQPKEVGGVQPLYMGMPG